MKRSTLFVVFGAAALILLGAQGSRAQSGTAPNAVAPKQDQVIQELLGEVRQLRIALQHISVNAYRGQVMVERLRLQQEQVNRLAQQLNAVRDAISDMKAAQINAKERLDEVQQQQEKGVVSESTVQEMRALFEQLKRRDQGMSDREAQLSSQLEAERVNLADLNKRLDALELEMMTTANQGDEPRGRLKQ
jgi:predicted nuclease with TOPRIM domain